MAHAWRGRLRCTPWHARRAARVGSSVSGGATQQRSVQVAPDGPCAAKLACARDRAGCTAPVGHRCLGRRNGCACLHSRSDAENASRWRSALSSVKMLGRRWKPIGWAALIVLAGTGAGLAFGYWNAGDPDVLFHSRFGHLLIAKAAAVPRCLIALGRRARLRTRPAPQPPDARRTATNAAPANGAGRLDELRADNHDPRPRRRADALRLDG